MYQHVLDFWFNEIEPKQWWVKDETFDQLITSRFLKLHQQANAGELYSWRDTHQGRLAEIIVLDQFSRNMFRDTPQAFASDTQALMLAQEAFRAKAHDALTQTQTSFLYMPYMHSESKAIHEVAPQIFKEHCSPDNYTFEMKHKVIIDRFSRYPHRNKILDRDSSAAEMTFLSQPGSSF
jgi:uncharacterized protein (DUF924 family)